MLNQRLMSTALIKRGNKFLLIKRSNKNKMCHNQWQFPEGGVKFGESPLQALKREIKEETKLILEDAKYLGNISSVLKEFDLKLWHFIRMFYRCNTKGNIKLSKKHSEYKWFTKEQIEKLELLNGLNYKDFKRFLR